MSKTTSFNLKLPVSRLEGTVWGKLREIERWILSWGSDAIAIKPKQLVDAVKESAKKLLRVN